MEVQAGQRGGAQGQPPVDGGGAGVSGGAPPVVPAGPGVSPGHNFRILHLEPVGPRWRACALLWVQASDRRAGIVLPEQECSHVHARCRFPAGIVFVSRKRRRDPEPRVARRCQLARGRGPPSPPNGCNYAHAAVPNPARFQTLTGLGSGASGDGAVRVNAADRLPCPPAPKTWPRST